MDGVMTTLMTERTDADALRQCVERIVRDRPIGSGGSAIVGIHRQQAVAGPAHQAITGM